MATSSFYERDKTYLLVIAGKNDSGSSEFGMTDRITNFLIIPQ